MDVNRASWKEENNSQVIIVAISYQDIYYKGRPLSCEMSEMRSAAQGRAKIWPKWTRVKSFWEHTRNTTLASLGRPKVQRHTTNGRIIRIIKEFGGRKMNSPPTIGSTTAKVSSYSRGAFPSNVPPSHPRVVTGSPTSAGETHHREQHIISFWEEWRTG